MVADELVVAIGRSPHTDDLGLDTVGLEPGESIEVDDHMRASGVEGDWLYAIGDVNGRSLLTHMGKYQSRVAATVILGVMRRPPRTGLSRRGSSSRIRRWRRWATPSRALGLPG